MMERLRSDMEYGDISGADIAISEYYDKKETVINGILMCLSIVGNIIILLSIFMPFIYFRFDGVVRLGEQSIPEFILNVLRNMAGIFEELFRYGTISSSPLDGIHRVAMLYFWVEVALTIAISILFILVISRAIASISMVIRLFVTRSQMVSFMISNQVHTLVCFVLIRLFVSMMTSFYAIYFTMFEKVVIISAIVLAVIANIAREILIINRTKEEQKKRKLILRFTDLFAGFVLFLLAFTILNIIRNSWPLFLYAYEACDNITNLAEDYYYQQYYLDNIYNAVIGLIFMVSGLVVAFVLVAKTLAKKGRRFGVCLGLSVPLIVISLALILSSGALSYMTEETIRDVYLKVVMPYIETLVISCVVFVIAIFGMLFKKRYKEEL